MRLTQSRTNITGADGYVERYGAPVYVVEITTMDEFDFLLAHEGSVSGGFHARRGKGAVTFTNRESAERAVREWTR